jgi:hypothetical protein
MNETKAQIVTLGVTGAGGSCNDLVNKHVCPVLAQIGLPQQKMYRSAGSHAEAKKAGA